MPVSRPDSPGDKQSAPRAAQADAAHPPGSFTLAFAHAITGVGRDIWDGLDGAGQPFVSYDYLEALERTGAVGEDTGWVPQHAVLRNESDAVVAVMPAYLKFHSWGEFVFDWAWADAYRRYGLQYYPKLLCAIPFTPVTGHRILIARGTPADDSTRLRASLLAALADAVNEMDVSSFHLLFPREEDRAAMAASGFMLRKDCQFQWQNRDFGSFEDFLAMFASAKRKKVKRERRRMEELGITFEWLPGDAIDEDTWRQVYRFYASTFLKRGHEPYFPPALFPMLGERLGSQLQVCLARHAGRAVATAVFFRDATTLYGRYWGCAEEFHSLHFETCYYQGIDYCIREGLQRFEPGTQGEHKLSRGFEPTTTWSGHVIGEPAFARAIEDYLGREREGVDAYMRSASEHLPFRRDEIERR